MTPLKIDLASVGEVLLHAFQVTNCEIYRAYLDRSGEDENAKERIVEFLGASDFDEVLMNRRSRPAAYLRYRQLPTWSPTVMWLLENQIRLQCFKATPTAR